MEEEKIVEEKETKKEKKNKEKELIDALNLKVKELEDKNLRISAEMINSLRRKDEDNARMMKYVNSWALMDSTSTSMIDMTMRAIAEMMDSTATIMNANPAFLALKNAMLSKSHSLYIVFS